jgi:putative hemolysin
MNLIYLFLLIGLNAFFVAVEYAAIAARRSRLELLIVKETKATRMVEEWLSDPLSRDRLIAANQIYITLISLAMGALGADAFKDLLVPVFNRITLPVNWAILRGVLTALPFILSLLIVTAFQVVLGEQVPKVTVLRAPEKFALFAAPVMRILNAIFAKFIDVMDWAARQVLALFGISVATTHTSRISLEELELMVTGPELEGVIKKPEKEMISAIFDFRDLTVRQVCVPRTEIVSLDETSSLDEALEIFSREKVTKMPVFREDLDHVVGMLYLHDVVSASRAAGKKPKQVKDLAREALFVPETISVSDLLVQFKTNRQHIAIVMDEFSGTTGLVTLEDLLEEIVGEYSDLNDAASPEVQMLAGGQALVEGLILMTDFNQQFGLNLRDENYHTLAGYFLGKLNRMPRVGDVVDDLDNGVSLKVDAMDRMRITRILVTRIPPGKEQPDG